MHLINKQHIHLNKICYPNSRDHTPILNPILNHKSARPMQLTHCNSHTASFSYILFSPPSPVPRRLPRATLLNPRSYTLSPTSLNPDYLNTHPPYARPPINVSYTRRCEKDRPRGGLSRSSLRFQGVCFRGRFRVWALGFRV